MKRLPVIVVAVWAMVPLGAMAQPTELSDCMGPGTDLLYCQDISTADLLDTTCLVGPRVFELFTGRIAWWPLKYVGPISVEVNALEFAGVRFPLYIELIDVKNHPPDVGYCDGPANVIMQVNGSPTCDGWETVDPLDLSPWGLSVGDTYVIRAHFFVDGYAQFHSPYLGCIRVILSPTAVVPATWSVVKGLYR